MIKFIVDQRVGCIAVRIQHSVNENEPGLNYDTPGVVAYYSGIYKSDKGRWSTSYEQLVAANNLCNILNEKDIPASWAIPVSQDEIVGATLSWLKGRTFVKWSEEAEDYLMDNLDLDPDLIYTRWEIHG